MLLLEKTTSFYLLLIKILERLASRTHYYCLNGYLGFYQIPVVSEDQEKTTFHLPI